MEQRRVRIFVTGRVQGVFFRQALKVMAKKNGILGWVRNLKDGRVEAVLEGDEEGLGRVIEWAHAGPANARVDDIEIRNEEGLGGFDSFDVRYVDGPDRIPPPGAYLDPDDVAVSFAAGMRAGAGIVSVTSIRDGSRLGVYKPPGIHGFAEDHSVWPDVLDHVAAKRHAKLP